MSQLSDEVIELAQKSNFLSDEQKQQVTEVAPSKTDEELRDMKVQIFQISKDKIAYKEGLISLLKMIGQEKQRARQKEVNAEEETEREKEAESAEDLLSNL